MRRTEALQKIRIMRFMETFDGWQERRLTQAEAARLLGVNERTFRRYIDRYHDAGLAGLADKRLSQASHRRQAPVDELVRLDALYRERYDGWNGKHFHWHYCHRHDGGRSYTWVKNRLQAAGLVKKAPGRGKHRTRREPSPLPAEGITTMAAANRYTRRSIAPITPRNSRTGLVSPGRHLFR